MNLRIQTVLSTFGLAAALLGVAASASAQTDPAECRPGDILCAEGRLGPIEGRLRIGIGEPPPPPPPPPPVVVVEPPPVVVAPPPPPQVVVVEAAPPPPPVVVAPPPTVYAPREPVTLAVETRTRRTTTYEMVPTFDMGLHLQLSGMFTDRIAMGGIGGAARIRPNPHVAIDLGLGAYYGVDYESSERWEVPLTADLLVFFNPQHVFQFYMLVGGGVDWAAQGVSMDRRFRRSAELFYLGGELGLGAEIRLSRFFAINGDIRGFLRENVAGGNPEFSEGGRTTNTSMGLYGNIGMTFYFFGN
jgi:hypothetical protein